MKNWTAIMAMFAVAGCAMPPGTFTPTNVNAPIVAGPPIEDVVTSFDRALSCLRGRIQPGVIFAVGQVVDSTGKETYADGGTGKFVTQGAGEMVQSALFRAGVSVVNRRDANISIVESNWGIRDIKRQVPVNFYISGSINSIDFIPGGGYSAQIAGVGPKFRQSRILVALDLTMTDAYSGRVVASVPLQKQIFTRELGGGVNTFFGDTLVQLDAGGMEREAMHFALRQMLSLATFELLGQLMNQATFNPCQNLVEGGAGMVRSTGTADKAALQQAIKAMHESAAQTSMPPPPLEVPVSKGDMGPAAVQVAGQPQGQQPQGQQPQGQAQQNGGKPIQTESALRGQKAMQAATQAIRVSKDSLAATDRKTSIAKAAEALQLSNLALMLLREAAEGGFGGDDAEVAAVVVQQALSAAQEAGAAASQRPADGAKPAAAPAVVSQPLNPAPASAGVSPPGSAAEATPPKASAAVPAQGASSQPSAMPAIDPFAVVPIPGAPGTDPRAVGVR